MDFHVVIPQTSALFSRASRLVERVPVIVQVANRQLEARELSFRGKIVEGLHDVQWRWGCEDRRDVFRVTTTTRAITWNLVPDRHELRIARGEVDVVLLDDAISDGSERSYRLPGGSLLEFLRYWPDQTGGCRDGIFKVVDAEGVLSPGSLAVASQDVVIRSGNVMYPEEWERERSALIDRETTTGRCDAAREKDLRTLSQYLRDEAARGGSVVQVLDDRVFVPSGAYVTTVSSVNVGVVDLVACSYLEPDVKAASSSALPSLGAVPYAAGLSWQQMSCYSVSFPTDPGDTVTVELNAMGCSLFLALWRS